jgi:hypothetical protein
LVEGLNAGEGNAENSGIAGIGRLLRSCKGIVVVLVVVTAAVRYPALGDSRR